MKNENLKLNSDMTIIKKEHQEMSNLIIDLEKKNNELIHENMTLKDILYSKKQVSF